MDKPHGDNNISIDGNNNNVNVNNYQAEKIIRIVDDHQYNPDTHISPSQQLKITEIVSETSEMMKGCDENNYSAKMYKSLYNKYLIPKYTLLPKESFAEAIDFLKRQKAIYRKNLKVLNATRFKEYTAPIIETIWNIRHKNEDLLEFASLKLNKKVHNIRKLSVNDLDTLYNRVKSKK
ncbi:MAG: hypothetical protein LBH45_07140 [Campylobacteraceae bacterium]|jgi:hypothetical protein|nr:hypothetical protein [Campylobacteraceae bacterium]